jgi:hypothetical protein
MTIALRITVLSHFRKVKKPRIDEATVAVMTIALRITVLAHFRKVKTTTHRLRRDSVILHN